MLLPFPYKGDIDCESKTQCGRKAAVFSDYGLALCRECYHKRTPTPTYEVAEHSLQFDCKYAVYPINGDTSMCYCTDESRAKLIAAALNNNAEQIKAAIVDAKAHQELLWENKRLKEVNANKGDEIT